MHVVLTQKQVSIMNLDLLSQLEDKVHTALETIELLKLELEDLRKVNNELQLDNEGMSSQLNQWHEKVNGLLTRINLEVKSAL
jgi:cell division protein ZapB